MTKIALALISVTAMFLTSCASTPEPQIGDAEASRPEQQQQAQQGQVQQQTPQNPQAQEPETQQQAATLGNPQLEPENGPDDPVLVNQMSREDWLANLKDVLSTELCTQDEIFRSCYPVSEQECRQHIESITMTCANRYESWIPENMREEDRRNWDAQVGECTGSAMASLLDAVYPVSNAQSCQEKLDNNTST